jgi:hypothetical protein
MSGDYWSHIRQAYEDVSIYDGAEVFLPAFRELPPHVGDLLAAHWILSEVANGGLLQFFLNPTGVLAPEAAQGFDRMGLSEVAELVRKAMAYFGATYPREMEEREAFFAQQHGHSPDDEDWQPFKHHPFEDVERTLYELGAPDLSKVYDQMDLYATRNGG